MEPVDLEANKQKSFERSSQKYPNLNKRRVINLDEFGNPVEPTGTVIPRFPLKNIFHH